MNSDIGARLGAALGERYRLERELGGGGMSRVFLAEEVRLGRKVVVKVLPPEMSAAVNVERFEREIQLAARLQHPHIVPLLSAGAEGDLLYYIMPFIEGESLRAKLAREGELPVREVVQILKEVLDALHYAHEHKVVHRDIKPDNVMISGRHALVTDFGVAKAVSDSTGGGATLTSLGVALGTPSYMAPEQAAGDPHVDQRADIYAVGAMAYEMLSGQPPFTGNPQAVLAKHITEAPTAVTTHRSTVPPALSEIILRCLAKKPADRYQQADELIPQLDALLTPSGGMTPTTAQPAIAVSKSRRKALLLIGVGVVAAGLLLVLGRALFGGKAGGANAAATARPMLVVLPIQNLGPADDQYFADGLTDEVTNRLGSVSGLGVISRTSAMKYAGAARDLRVIGRELSVQYALETTIRTDRGGGQGVAKQARVSADLIKVGDDTHVWSDRYTVALTPGQIFDVQAKIAEAVAGALNVVLLEREKQAVSAKGTDNAEAYEAYLKGSRVVLNAGGGEPPLREAERQLTRAVTVDSGFAVAYAQLARVHLALFWFGFDRAEVRLPLAERAIQRALALQPDLPEAHLAKGFYHYWGLRDFPPALAEFQRVRTERPSDADAFAAESFILRRQGKVNEALAAITEAARLDPRSPGYPYFIGLCYLNLRQYGQAEQAMRKTLEIEPGFSNAKFYLGSIRLFQGDTAGFRHEIEQLPQDDPATPYSEAQFYVVVRDYAAALRAANRVPPAFRVQTAFLPRTLVRGQVLALLGNQLAARQNFDSTLTAIRAALAKQLNPTDEAPVQIALALTFAGLGRRDEALKAGLRATELVPISLDISAGGEFRQGLAEVQAAVGDQAGAIAGLDSLLKLPGEFDVGNLRLEPRWDPLRSNPAFQRLLVRR